MSRERNGSATKKKYNAWRVAIPLVMLGGLSLALEYVLVSKDAVRLAVEAVRTQAVVVLLQCEYGSTFRYRFEARGRQFESYADSMDLDRLCHTMKVGDRVPVAYLPSDPAVSVVGDPAARLASERGGVAFLVLLVGLVIGFVEFGGESRRRFIVMIGGLILIGFIFVGTDFAFKVLFIPLAIVALALLMSIA